MQRPKMMQKNQPYYVNLRSYLALVLNIEYYTVPLLDQHPPVAKTSNLVSTVTIAARGNRRMTCTFANVTWRYFCESCVKNGAIVWHGALQQQG
jgi:hypothetical protein